MRKESAERVEELRKRVEDPVPCVLHRFVGITFTIGSIIHTIARARACSSIRHDRLHSAHHRRPSYVEEAPPWADGRGTTSTSPSSASLCLACRCDRAYLFFVKTRRVEDDFDAMRGRLETA